MSLFHRKCTIGGVNADVWIAKQAEDNTFLYCAQSIIHLLGYTKPRNALQHIKPHWRKNWGEIKASLEPGCLGTIATTTPPTYPDSKSPARWQPNTVFIREAGVHTLITKSKLNAAKEFKLWLFDSVLPELRQTDGQDGRGNVEAVALPRRTVAAAANGSTTIGCYDKTLTDVQLELLRLKLELLEVNSKLAKYDITIAELKRNYERQLSEFKEGAYRMQLILKDLETPFNITSSTRVVAAATTTTQTFKEDYVTGYMVRGERRSRYRHHHQRSHHEEMKTV
ncbi:unnamed protein product [Parnassius mnemosyne]|uniref:Bro-N domain-containing protein n=1 Tax=Parnassius mnemosyne TaxID=213953 RepID=A0AAV1K9N5_9NEOP